MFKGLNRMIQYGDFVAKAVIYDHRTKVRKEDPAQVLEMLAEEFVAYNFPAGRGRDFLENMGMLWFYNYKIRIMKIAARMARERPLSALVFGSGVGPALAQSLAELECPVETGASSRQRCP